MVISLGQLIRINFMVRRMRREKYLRVGDGFKYLTYRQISVGPLELCLKALSLLWISLVRTYGIAPYSNNSSSPPNKASQEGPFSRVEITTALPAPLPNLHWTCFASNTGSQEMRCSFRGGKTLFLLKSNQISINSRRNKAIVRRESLSTCRNWS